MVRLISIFVGLVFIFASLLVAIFWEVVEGFSNIFFNWVVNLTPNVNFLSDVIAFEAAILGFFIPLSITTISNISERYQSDIIIRPFEEGWENKVLPLLLVVDIIAAILLRFVFPDDVAGTAWKALSWSLLLLAVITIVITYLSFVKLRFYISNTENLLDEFFKDANQSLK